MPIHSAQRDRPRGVGAAGRFPAREGTGQKPGQAVRTFTRPSYQHFGTYHGNVVKVSQTILTSPDATGPIVNEPAYRVTVGLSGPTSTPMAREWLCSRTCFLLADVIPRSASLMSWLDKIHSVACDGNESHFTAQPFALGRRRPQWPRRLAMVASYHGHRIDMNTRGAAIRPRSTASACAPSSSSRAISTFLARLPVRVAAPAPASAACHSSLGHEPLPGSEGGHPQRYCRADPAAGEKFYPLPEASKHLTGVALELAPSESFIIQDERARLPLSAFLGQLSGSGHALIQILVLSIVLQLLILAAPLYLQLTVDEVIARGDVNLLIVRSRLWSPDDVEDRHDGAPVPVLLVVQNVLQFQLGARRSGTSCGCQCPTSRSGTSATCSRFHVASADPQPSCRGHDCGCSGRVYGSDHACDDFRLQHAASPRRARRDGALCRRTACSLPCSLAAHRSDDPSSSPGEFHLYRGIRAIQSLKPSTASEREGQWLNRYSEVVSTNVRLAGRKSCSPPSTTRSLALKT